MKPRLLTVFHEFRTTNYLGIGILSSAILTPFMLPFFFFPFLSGSFTFEPSLQSVGLMMAVFMLVFLPVMALVQGVTITFMKSAYVLVYLRLTHSSNASVANEANP